ncbi:MAG: hypothetical protein ACREAB_07295 [Blastocatellia bacterium]
MKSANLAFALALIFPAICVAQTPDAGMRTQERITKVREAMGGESNLKRIRDLSLTGKFHRRIRSAETTGEIRIDLLAPDKILITEESNPRPAVFVTRMLAMNGDKVWFDQKTHRPTGDDGSAEFTRRQDGRTSPIATETSGMRGVTGGSTTVRTNPPGTNTTERTILGMPLPSSQGRDLDTDAKKMEEARKASGRKAPGANRAPSIETPDLRSALEKQLRKELACLMFALLLTPPSSLPFEFAYAGPVKSDQGVVEAIDISGPDQFAARLFMDQTNSLPLMLSYGEVVRKNAGYVVSASATAQTDEARPEDLEEIAVQLYLSDYRRVNDVMMPFRIIKAVNGAPVDEWKIEKYKLNPDLKPKKFEKR